MNNKSISPVIKIMLLTVLLLIIIIISLFMGNYKISPKNYSQIFNYLIFSINSQITESLDWSVFYHIRLPRIIAVMMVGSSLSITGAAYQNIFRNPLVSPDILGVSAGAGLGVAVGLLYTSGSMVYVYISAFIFGTAAVGLTYLISMTAHRNSSILMVLAGIIIASLSNALLSLLKYLADPMEKLPGIVFYLMGGFSRIGWREVYYLIPIFVIGSAVLLLFRWQLNIFSLGEEEASSLGINIFRIRVIIIFFSTIMVAASVAAAGQITWIGLVVPHIARYIVGTNYRYFLPTAALCGSLMLLIMDNLARTVSGAEIPISIITALIGAPFFAYLLLSKKESGWN
ncbi:MAG: FecCD family ABC transporter permease [Bacillota bacterium]